jgi:hypothetical protein
MPADQLLNRTEETMATARWIVLFTTIISFGVLDAVAQSPDAYEPVLVPVVLANTLPGMYGSLWSTSLAIFNGTNAPISMKSDVVSFYGCQQSTDCLPDVPPLGTFGGAPVLWREDSIPPAAILYVKRDIANGVFFHAVLQEQSSGNITTIPIIHERELYSTLLALLQVPVSTDASRTILRIYALGDGTVRVTILGSMAPRLQWDVVLTNTASGVTMPPQPAFAEVRLDPALIPELLGTQKVHVLVEPLTPGMRLWAFASVTDNATQAVQFVTPD